MPAAGPYNITQVDVPGAINAYQAGQENRIRQMLLQRQISREDRLEQAYGLARFPGQQSSVRGAVRAYGGGESETTPAAGQDAPARSFATPGMYDAAKAIEAYGGAPAPSAASAAPAGPSDPNKPSPAPASLPHPTTLPAATAPPGSDAARRPQGPLPESWLSANEPMLKALVSVSPREAFEMASALQGMDEAQLKRVRDVNSEISRASIHLRRLPSEAERRQELERITPGLLAAGITPEQIAGADLSDNGLNWLALQGRDVDKILNSERAERRLDWDIDDDIADNEGLADYRNETIRVRERGQDVGSRDRRRNQDIASTDRRRGQEVTDTRARRGQDITDKRVRDSAGFRGRSGSGGFRDAPAAGGGVADGMIIRNPKTGKRMKMQGGKWVPHGG